MITNLRNARRVLSPAINEIKSHAELTISKTSPDHVIFNSSTSSGITDLAYEWRKSSKKVSIHFKMNEEGIASYRRLAKVLADNKSVELEYTPHFGQSRISFEWDEFWNILDQSQLGTRDNYLQLEGGSTIDTTLSDIVSSNMSNISESKL